MGRGREPSAVRRGRVPRPALSRLEVKTMAWVQFPFPGSDLGPCKGPCQHFSCNDIKRDADMPCQHCGKPLGYGVPLSLNPPFHVSCALRKKTKGGVR